jgi:hypothetical protein
LTAIDDGGTQDGDRAGVLILHENLYSLRSHLEQMNFKVPPVTTGMTDEPLSFPIASL